MLNIQELLQKIREMINTPILQQQLMEQSGSWNKLCCCLDVLEDTELAIDSYPKMPEISDDGINYLIIYGILQALFVQQDAVKNLLKSIGIKNKQIPFNIRKNEIRDIRNETSGHPTNKDDNGERYIFISRSSLSKYSYDLMVAYSDGKKDCFKSVEIQRLIDNQHEIVHEGLSRILECLNNLDSEHKRNFRSNPLRGFFAPSLNDDLQKVFEGISSGEPHKIIIARRNLDSITQDLKNFKNELESRRILNAYSNLRDLLDKIDRSIFCISDYFDDSAQSNMNVNDARIYVDSLKANIAELLEAVEEIDKEYESVP